MFTQNFPPLLTPDREHNLLSFVTFYYCYKNLVASLSLVRLVFFKFVFHFWLVRLFPSRVFIFTFTCLSERNFSLIANAIRFKVKLVGISNYDIVDGKITPILGLIWSIILRFQVSHKEHYFLTLICLI